MDEAYNFFAYGARLDLEDYNHNTDQGLHVTSTTGVWASMIFGFGRMRTDGDILIFNPTITAQWKSYRFRVCFQGALIEVRVNRECVEFQVISGPSVMVNVFGEIYTLNAKSVTIKPKPVA